MLLLGKVRVRAHTLGSQFGATEMTRADVQSVNRLVHRSLNVNVSGELPKRKEGKNRFKRQAEHSVSAGLRKFV